MNNTPVIFADGTAFFSKLSTEYIRHDKGYFILAPSGVGKTYFVSKQVQKDWIDGDTLWPLSGADLTSDGWVSNPAIVEEVNRKSDVITHEARKLGFWIIGSSNDTLRPDAIVLPEWEQHREYIDFRESTEYDGGAKIEDLEGIKAHRAIIKKWAYKGVPEFKSVEEASDYLAAL